VLTIGICTCWVFNASALIAQLFNVLGLALGSACGTFFILSATTRIAIGDDWIVFHTCGRERRIATGDIKGYKLNDASIVLYASTNERPLIIPRRFEGFAEIQAWVAARATNLDEVERLDSVLTSARCC
jgi:hypothetical protein